jgi:hypothetical protein
METLMGVAGMAIGGIASSLIGASSANKAADAQVEAANATIKEQKRQYDLGRADIAPWRDAGLNALGAYQYELGLGPRPGSAPAVITQSGAGADGTMARQAPQATPNDMDLYTRLHLMKSGAISGDNWTDPESHVAQGFGTGRFGVRGAGDNRQMMVDGMPVGEFNNNMELRRLMAQYGGGNQPPPQQSGPASYSVNGQSFDSMEDAQAYANSQATGDGGYRGFQETPGYQYMLDEGQNALANYAAARGMRLSGATLKRSQEHATGLANQEYGTYLNRLSGLAGVGQTATNTGISAGQNYANAAGNALMQAGQARASGYMGVNNAIQGGISNLYSVYGMQQAGYFDQ